MRNFSTFEFFTSIQDKVAFWLKGSLIWTAYNMIFLGLLYSLSMQNTFIGSNLILVFIIYSSILLFPSTQVLFSLARTAILKDELPKISLRAFFKLMTLHYKNVFLTGIFFNLLYFLVYVNIYLISGVNYVSQGFLLLLSLLMLQFMLNFFMLNIHYDNSLKHTVLNSMILTLSKPKLTLKYVIILSVFSVISIFIPILILFTISVIVHILFNIFIKEMSRS